MHLISKKDLLAVTGISYGQLYRWKRERLIPEEWFIKQSSYTGQETFFPREQILSRVQSILELKDKYSLEELAAILSPETAGAPLSADVLKEMDDIDNALAELLKEVYGREQFEFIEVAFVSAIVDTAKKAGLDDTAIRSLIQKSARAVSKQKGEGSTCTLFLSEGEYHTVFFPNAVSAVFDSSIGVAGQCAVSEIADKIRLKYKNMLKK